MKKLIYSLIFLISLQACGGGIDVEEAPGLQLGDVTLSVYQLPSAFPPDIEIPDLPGMESTAFVLDFDTTSVLPIDLNQNPSALSQSFPVFDGGAAGLSLPSDLFILSLNQAFVLTSQELVYFNPSTAEIMTRLDLTQTINLEQSFPYSQAVDCDFDGTEESSVGPGAFSPSFPNQVVANKNQVFVSFSNLCFTPEFNSVYTQGMVLAFELIDSDPYLSPATNSVIALEGFNASGLTLLEDRLIATTSGDTALVDGQTQPKTPSFLNEISLDTLNLNRSVSLGLVAANFKSLAVDILTKKAWVGSSAFSEVYEVDLENFVLENTLIFSEEAANYLNDQLFVENRQLLFSSSFNQSAVGVVDFSIAEEFLPDLFNFTFPDQPGVTGAGPMAVRPGIPGLDFTGPDLWVLTGNGTLSSAKTYE